MGWEVEEDDTLAVGGGGAPEEDEVGNSKSFSFSIHFDVFREITIMLIVELSTQLTT